MVDVSKRQPQASNQLLELRRASMWASARW